MTDTVAEKHRSVTLIKINRPEKMNSLDFATNDAMVEARKAFDHDDDARVAAVTVPFRTANAGRIR